MTSPQWPRVFEVAARVRQAAVDVVERVGSGELDLSAAHDLGDRDPLVGRVFAVKVYEAVPGIGKVRARRTMSDVGLPPDVVLASVSAESRDMIEQRFLEQANV